MNGYNCEREDKCMCGNCLYNAYNIGLSPTCYECVTCSEKGKDYSEFCTECSLKER